MRGDSILDGPSPKRGPSKLKKAGAVTTGMLTLGMGPQVKPIKPAQEVAHAVDEAAFSGAKLAEQLLTEAPRVARSQSAAAKTAEKANINQSSPHRSEASYHPTEAQLVQRLQQQPKVEPRPELLNSPWVDHFSESQYQQIENLNLSASQKQFLQELILMARFVYASGYDINMPGMVAQALEEVGWQHGPNFNDWGMKPGTGYRGQTQFYPHASEFDPAKGHDVTRPDNFRAFRSFKEAALNYADFMVHQYPIASEAKSLAGFAEIIQHEPYLENGEIKYKAYATGHKGPRQYTEQLIELNDELGLEEVSAFPTEQFTP